MSGPKCELDTRFVFGEQIRSIGSTMGSHHDFRDVIALVWTGKPTPVRDRVMPIDQGREACAAL